MNRFKFYAECSLDLVRLIEAIGVGYPESPIRGAHIEDTSPANVFTPGRVVTLDIAMPKETLLTYMLQVPDGHLMVRTAEQLSI